GEPFPLAPDRGYAADLKRAITRLNGATRGQAAALRRADTAAAQARAAGKLRASYRKAASSLRGATANPQVSGANANVVAALVAVGGAYERRATAAGTADPAAYASARSQIAKGDARLRRALRAV
ncbi:MAG: hypothetical protein QOE69_2863, partial [Thermoleophilaceae bacterium]|nr:hypothetical protein [Thermoleophilaceae bacterium]